MVFSLIKTIRTLPRSLLLTEPEFLGTQTSGEWRQRYENTEKGLKVEFKREKLTFQPFFLGFRILFSTP